MLIEKTKKIIDEANRGSKKLRITNYAASSGSLSTMDVELLDPENGYHEMIKKSLILLPTIPNSGGADEELFKTAKEQLEKSFKKTLEGTHSRKESNQVESDDRYRYGLNNGDVNQVVIMHMKSLNTVTHTAAPEKKQRELTIVKDSIRKRLPIGKYNGKIILSPGKFDGIEVLP